MPQRDPLILDCPIGGSGGGTAATRWITPWLLENGWDAYIKTQVQPAIDWGVRRVRLGNPFGYSAAQTMDFSQYPDASALAAFQKLCHGFESAWRPLVQSGIEVIAYVGGPYSVDKTISAEIDWMIWQCLHPFLLSGCSIAFDASCAIPPDDPGAKVIDRLRAQGTRVYLEANPALQWAGMPWLALESWYRLVRAQQAKTPNEAPYAIPLSQLHFTGGECIRIIDVLPDGHSWGDTAAWMPGMIKQVQSEKCTACAGVNGLLKQTRASLGI